MPAPRWDAPGEAQHRHRPNGRAPRSTCDAVRWRRQRQPSGATADDPKTHPSRRSVRHTRKRQRFPTCGAHLTSRRAALALTTVGQVELDEISYQKSDAIARMKVERPSVLTALSARACVA